MKKILISLVLVLGMLMVPAAAVAQNMYADVNGDLEVNIADINAVIGVILSDVSNPSADVNGDGEVNIADINAVIDIILNGGFDPHLLEVCEKVVEIDHVIVGYYKQCESLDELMDHADDIRALDGVEEVYSDGHSVMFVRIKDFRTILYSFYDEPDEDDNAVFQMEQQMNHLIQAVPHHQNGTTAYTYSDIRDAKFLAVNQQTGFSYSTQSAGTTCSLFRELGFQAEVVSAPNVEFFRDGIFDCDYLFLIAHGAYDFNQNIHWIATSESVQRDANGDLDPNFVIRYANYSETELTFDYSVVCVSEHFINSSPRSFRHPGKGIVFNVACHSVQGPKTEATDTTDYSLAEVFITKGAGAYIGYDESNWGGQLAGLQFFSGMLSGMSVGRSFDFLSFPLKHEYHKKDNPRFWADLKKYPEQDNIYNECINRPIITLEDKSDDNHLQIDLCADNLYMTYFAPTGYQSWNIVNDMNGLKSLPYDYGFELSESEQFTNIISLDEKHIGEDGLGLTYLHYIYSLTYDGSQTDSKIMPNTTYWVRAYVYDGQGYNYSEPVMFTTADIEIPDIPAAAVDLGLPSGTLWATCNIGATAPEEYGDYFAWGETEPKDYYDSNTYKWCNGSYNTLTKYCIHPFDGYNGFTDGKTVLDPEDDAAYVNWGPQWRMPTFEQQRELLENCIWTWTTQNGVNGSLVTGPNGNSIFLPAAGIRWDESVNYAGSTGYYWSRTLYPYHSIYAYSFAFGSMGEVYHLDRSQGFTVRAVHVTHSNGQRLYIEQQSLDLGEVPMGQTRTGKLTIVNNTMAAKTLIASADAPFWFKEDESCVSTKTVVVPDNSCGSVAIQFTATTLGDFSGDVTFTCEALDGGECIIPVTARAIANDSNHEWVDLDLPSGTLWATCNVGASAPEDYGDYFAWGETEPKDYYGWSTYKWCNGFEVTMTKYCTYSNYGADGFTDGKTELDPEDDAAYVNWGPSWRMPSKEQQDELRNNCTWTWTTQNGVNGSLVTGPNGNSIFLPAAGGHWFEVPPHDTGSYGRCWSRTLSFYTSNSYVLGFNSGHVYWDYYGRCFGYPVRAVRVSQN